MLVVPDTASISNLNALIAAAAPLDGAKVHLFKNDVVPARGMVLALFTEADFTGYAASSAVVWSAAAIDASGQPTTMGGGKTFTVGAVPTVTNSIFGVFVTNTAGTVLLYAERFAAPVGMTNPNQVLIYVPVFGALSQAP